MGHVLLGFIVLSFSYLSLAADTVVPLNVTNSMYGAGSFKVPCQTQDVLGECKIDTGVNISSLKTDLFTTVPKSLGTATYTSLSGSKIKCDFVSLPSLKIANNIEMGPLEPVVCPSQDDNKTSENLIGIDAFLENSFVLNPTQATLTLLENAPTLENKMVGKKDEQILMAVQSGFKKPLEAIAMFDTGAALSTVDIKLVQAQPENYTIISTNSIGTDSHGNALNSYLVLGSVRVGNILITAEYFMAIDFTPFQEAMGENIQMILGFNAIKDYQWTFNMPERTWSVK